MACRHQWTRLSNSRTINPATTPQAPLRPFRRLRAIPSLFHPSLFQPVGDLVEIVDVVQVGVGEAAVLQKFEIGPEIFVEHDAERVDRRDGGVKPPGPGPGSRLGPGPGLGAWQVKGVQDTYPVRVIQASTEGRDFDWRKEATPDEWRHKMGILNALYLPGGEAGSGSGSGGLHPAITPVNTFRIVFNEYFGADFELLEDRSFTYPDLDHVYDFYEITDRLK